MENQKSNKGIISVLVIVIVILLVLCFLFATDTINFESNKINVDNNLSEQNNLNNGTINEADNNDSEQKNSNNETLNKVDSNMIDQFIGIYTYKGEYVEREENAAGNYDIEDDAWNTGKMAKEELKLYDNGVAEASAGNVRASGYIVKGKWYISDKELIIINENCKATVINNEAVYPNCQPIWTYTYKIENGTITFSSSNNSMATVILNKNNNG